MLGRDEDHVVNALAGDFDTRHVERLCVDVAVDRQREELPELRGVDVPRGEDRFAKIRAGAAVVELRCGYDLSVGKR